MNRVDTVGRSIGNLKEAIVSEESRRKLMFIGFNATLVVVAVTMSVVNVITSEYLLFIFTMTFAALCASNILLLRTRISEKVIYLSFAAEAMVLLGYFLVDGILDGFSVLWMCLIPSFALLIFGRRFGFIFSMVPLAMMIFLFWVPEGRNILQYTYTDTFMLRFPFLYTAICAIALLEEYMRGTTQNKLAEAERRYRYLYRHDALTRLYNRYGFNEIMDRIFADPQTSQIAMIIMDIDDFKFVNDRFGHSAGDKVLQSIAELPDSVLCEHCRYCRWGGEEFAVLMRCEHDPVATAERIRRYIEGMTVVYEGAEIHVTVSIGVCMSDDIRNTDIAALVNQADRCLYRSKDEGKNRVSAISLG